MLFGLLFLVGASLSAPLNLDKVPCQTQDVNLNGPYSLPLTALADTQFCTYTVSLPSKVNKNGFSSKCQPDSLPLPR